MSTTPDLTSTTQRRRGNRRHGPSKMIGLAIAAIVICALAPAAAQGSGLGGHKTQPVKAIVGPGLKAQTAPIAYRETVASLAKTIHFYHGVLGLELASKPTKWSWNRQEVALSGVRAESRSVEIAVPNQTFVLRFTQYRGIKQHAQQPAGPDYGQMDLTLTVKNAVAAYAALRAAHTPTLLKGGTIPSGEGTGTITVFVRDPDGMPVEVVQRSGPSDYFTVDPPTITNGPGMRYVIRGQIDFTVKTDQAALEFYRDLLGFDVNPGFSFLVGPNEHPVIPPFIAAIFGITPGSTWAAATGNCAAEIRCEYFEYDDPARINFRPAIQDPGAPSFEASSTDLNELLIRLKAAGIKVVTPGGRPVLVDGRQTILVRDTSGLIVRLEQAPLVSWTFVTTESFAAPGQPFPVGSTTTARIVYDPRSVRRDGDVVIAGHQHLLGTTWADPKGPAGTPVSNRSLFNVKAQTLDYQVAVTHGVPIVLVYTTFGFTGIYSQVDGSMLEGGRYAFSSTGPQVCDARTWRVDGTC